MAALKIRFSRSKFNPGFRFDRSFITREQAIEHAERWIAAGLTQSDVLIHPETHGGQKEFVVAVRTKADFSKIGRAK